MSDNTIKEFLVGLGVEIDQASVAKFDRTMADISEAAAALAATVAAMAAAVGAAVIKVSSDFDRLYWSSKNLGSSAGDIKALGYAFSQLGGSAGDADAAMKSIANFNLQYGPGAAGFLTHLGVAPKDIGDSAATLRDLEHIFQRMSQDGPMGRARANAYAGFLGISPDQLRVMLRDTGEYEKQLRAFAARMGINFDQATQSSNEFWSNIRALRMEFDLWVSSYGIKILERLEPTFEAIGHWIDQLVQGKNLTRAQVEIRHIVDDIGDLIGALDHLANSNAGERWGARMLWVIDNIIRATGQVTKIIDDLINHQWKKAWADAQHDPTRPWSDAGVGADPTSAPNARDNNLGASPKQPWNSKPASSSMEVAQYFQDRMRGSGFSNDQIKGIWAGIRAEGGGVGMAANGAFGIGQWRGPRAKALFARYGDHPSIAQQIEFLISELLGGDRGGRSVTSQHSAAGAMVAYLRDFMRPGPGLGGDLHRGYAALGMPTATLGGAGVTITQKTDIHVNGGSNPHDTAREVAHHQDGVNQRMVAASSVYQW